MPFALHPTFLHLERGAVRPLGDGTVDLTLAHPIGFARTFHVRATLGRVA